MRGLILSQMLLLAVPTAHAADRPAQDPPPEEPEPRSFGLDFSAGYGAGALLGSWPKPGVGGFLWLEAGLFPSSTRGGPRIGAGLWTNIGVAPLQTAVETFDGTAYDVPIRPQSYGLSVAMRADPSARWSGLFDLGFGRLDLSNYYCAPPSTSGSDNCGPNTVPLFDLRAGVRRTLGPIWIEGAVRGDWGQSRDPEAYGMTDWWKVGGELGVGIRVR